MRYRWSKRQSKYVPVKRRPYTPVLLPHEQRQLKHLKSIARGMAASPGPDKGQDFNSTAPFSGAVTPDGLSRSWPVGLVD